MKFILRTNWVLCLITCIPLGVSLAQREKSVLLPQSEAVNLTKQCSRTVPQHVTSTWQPTVNEIKIMESRLSQVSELKADCCSREQVKAPENYYMQYAGIVVNGKKYIYINAFRGTMNVPHWKEQPVVVCDGGSGFWGVMYDIEAGKFLNLSTNGSA